MCAGRYAGIRTPRPLSDSVRPVPKDGSSPSPFAMSSLCPVSAKKPFSLPRSRCLNNPTAWLSVFDGFTCEVFSDVALPVEELAAYVGVEQDSFVPVGLQGAFGAVQ